MINLQAMDEQFGIPLAVIEPQEGPKVTIPWDKIDEWIASIESKDEGDGGKGKPKVIDPGDRRN